MLESCGPVSRKKTEKSLELLRVESLARRKFLLGVGTAPERKVDLYPRGWGRPWAGAGWACIPSRGAFAYGLPVTNGKRGKP